MKILLLILFANICVFAIGQNLIPNPSFEDTVYCPLGTNNPQALATWFNPTLASPDYYNACANNGGGVPSNDWGYQEAQDGNAYVGIATYGSPNVVNYREYLEVKLEEPLVEGESYNWCMYISLLDECDLASNNLGISFSQDSLMVPLSQGLLNSQEYGSHDLVVTDSENWLQVSGNFVAQGDEKFMIIGNFRDDLDTDTIKVDENSSGGPNAYYFVDNVYVGIEPCIEAKVEMPNVFTPNHDGINDIFTFVKSEGLLDYSITILNRWGNRVYFGENEFQWDGTSQNSEPVAEGTYFYTLEYNSKEIKNGFVQVVR